MNRFAYFLVAVLATQASYSAGCRCTDAGGPFVSAECPHVTNRPSVQGEKMSMWFDSLSSDEFFMLLANFSGQKVCLAHGVSGNFMIKTMGKRPWAEVVRGVGVRYGFKVSIDQQYVLVTR